MEKNGDAFPVTWIYGKNVTMSFLPVMSLVFMKLHLHMMNRLYDQQYPTPPPPKKKIMHTVLVGILIFILLVLCFTFNSVCEHCHTQKVDPSFRSKPRDKQIYIPIWLNYSTASVSHVETKSIPHGYFRLASVY